MRRFSQRNQLVTLSDINITPLLDLAFVLLIIFIIISPSILPQQEHSIELNLPQGGAPSRTLERSDVRIVEITPQGQYLFEGQPMELARMDQVLAETHRLNPQLVVVIRVDQRGWNEHTFAALDLCRKHGIAIDVRTAPQP